MAEAQKPFLIGAAAGLVMLAIAAPAVGLLWKRAAADRSQILGALNEVSARIDKNNAAIDDMRKTASLAGVTKQMEELNARIKSTNEALAGVQKASLDNIRDRLEQVETSVKSGNAALAGLQKGLAPDGMSKQLGQLAANLTALETSLAAIKKATDGTSAPTLAAVKADPAAAPVKVAATLDAMKTVPGAPAVPTELIVVHMQNTAAPAVATAANAAIAPLSVHFQKIGGSDETAQTVALVGKLKDLLKNRKGCAVSIAGYSDTLGDDDINLAVSKDRAHVIAVKLKEALGNDVSIAETAWGERRLAEMTKDNVASKANRRVDIAVQCKP
jgi:outer membrane protein OmpA-like peptidoglycan-associated protein